MTKENFPHEAIAAIDDILQYGRTKHAVGSWRSKSVKHHVEKAKGHIQDYLYEVDRGEDHLACALTRMAMAIAVRAAGNMCSAKLCDKEATFVRKSDQRVFCYDHYMLEEAEQ